MATFCMAKPVPAPFRPLSAKPLPSFKPLVFKESTNIFKDIEVIKPLSKAKFKVYLIQSKVSKQKYAMKVFPYSKNKPNIHFQNEVRFSFVSHPNVIRTHHIEFERQSVSKGRVKKISYTVMEYAPHGDFFSFILSRSRNIDEKLIRTYFRQLIDGIEYLHDNGVSHMDIKPENLLLGEDFKLKITDFDLSHFVGDKIVCKGTKCFRAPELIQIRCKNAPAADIYSAGIMLFTFKTRGIAPHTETSSVNGIDFAGLMYDKNDEFWKRHCEIQSKPSAFFDEDFKNLFNAMTRLDPSERATIKQIKQSNWYNGPTYTEEEMKEKIGKIFNVK